VKLHGVICTNLAIERGPHIVANVMSGWWLSLALWKIWVSWDDDLPNWMESHKIHVPKLENQHEATQATQRYHRATFDDYRGYGKAMDYVLANATEIFRVTHG